MQGISFFFHACYTEAVNEMVGALRFWICTQ